LVIGGVLVIGGGRFVGGCDFLGSRHLVRRIIGSFIQLRIDACRRVSFGRWGYFRRNLVRGRLANHGLALLRNFRLPSVRMPSVSLPSVRMHRIRNGILLARGGGLVRGVDCRVVRLVAGFFNHREQQFETSATGHLPAKNGPIRPPNSPAA
jgi:hypothetical protein